MASETFFFLSFFGHQKGRARISLNIMKIAQKVGILIISAVQKCVRLYAPPKIKNLFQTSFRKKKLETFFWESEKSEENSLMNFQARKVHFSSEISPIFLS